MTNCTGKRCPVQVGKVDPAICEAYKDCQWATRPLTNADRINAMSVEEKADCLNDIWHHLVFGNDAPGPCGMCHEISISSCRACWMDWLKQEATDEQ